MYSFVFSFLVSALLLSSSAVV